MKTSHKRHVLIAAANPVVDLLPCLSKVRHESEEDARREASFRPYPCVWCSGWHTSAHGAKGTKKGSWAS
jgi:hypothetical protein